MKTEVYSWRIAPEVKSDLEREARLRGVSVSAILDRAVRDWLNKSGSLDGEEEQARIHAAAAKCFGALAGSPSRSENVRKLVRERLAKRYGR